MKLMSAILGTILVCGTFFSGQSYATHLTENIVWQLVFITGNRACSNYDYQMTNVYTEVTIAYMEMYQLGNTMKAPPVCVDQYKFHDYQFDNDVDLIILAYERKVGEVELNRLQVGGLFYHYGNNISKNHVIIFCDCPNFDFSDPVWTLSHELSHFILFYRGYGPDIVETLVHHYDSLYDYCLDNRLFDKPECQNIKKYVRVDTSAYKYPVVPPYEPSFSDNINIRSAPTVHGLQQQITKLWTEGKLSDSDFLFIMGYTLENDGKLLSSQYFDRQKTILADPEKDKKSKDHSTGFTLSDERTDKLLSRVPESFKISDDLPKEVDIPDWYKTVADFWVDKKLSNEEFFKNFDYLVKTKFFHDLQTVNKTNSLE